MWVCAWICKLVTQLHVVATIYIDVCNCDMLLPHLAILPVGIVIGFLNLFLFTVYMMQSFQ